MNNFLCSELIGLEFVYGLFGWKTVVVDKPTSEKIHTNNLITQPASNGNVFRHAQQNTFEKMGVARKENLVGGRGQASEFSHTLTLAKSPKFGNKENLGKIINIGVSELRPEDHFPAKTDKEKKKLEV